MNSESTVEFNFDNKRQSRAIRPKLLKLTEVQMPTRSRKKNKFKFKERSVSSVRERFTDDPAYTEDVRHLAFPMRRNSGPEIDVTRNYYSDHPPGMEFSSSGNNSDNYQLCESKMKRKKGGIYEKIGDYVESRLGHRVVDHVYEEAVYSGKKAMRNIRREESSSEEHLESKRHSRRGQSLDRSKAIDNQLQKRSSWFQRESRSVNTESLKKDKRDRSKQRQDDSPKRHTLDRTEQYVLEQIKNQISDYQRNSYPRQKHIQRQNASDIGHYLTSDCTTPEDLSAYHSAKENVSMSGKSNDSPIPANVKQKEYSKFQIGKRFLKGEIGIKSFNYYLLKEGLKSTKKNILKQRSEPPPPTAPISKSEENIYEEIFFFDKNNKKQSNANYPDCELCAQQCTNENCDICNRSCAANNANSHHRDGERNSKGSTHYTSIPTTENEYGSAANPNYSHNTNVNNYTKIGQQSQPVLQFQSYNPNNPGVYKIETTPVAFTSDYNPLQSIQQYQPPNMNIYQEINKCNRTKSSSSSDSLHQKYSRRLPNDFYTCPPRYIYPPQQPDYSRIDPKIYKTDSRASILSEMSIKSENSMKYQKPGEMSDSSIGDSLFSYPAQRRYFGSSESCRFGFECRRCSFDAEKCSFSDNCRYECRNCDCSSSYFSSDFDDTTNFSRKSSTRMSQTSSHETPYTECINAKGPKYAEDFIRHVNNVKNSTFQTGSLPHHSRGMMAMYDNGMRVGESKTLTIERRKKKIYDELMPIGNEVAYNLSYGMTKETATSNQKMKQDFSMNSPQRQINLKSNTSSAVRHQDTRIYAEIRNTPETKATTSMPLSSITTTSTATATITSAKQSAATATKQHTSSSATTTKINKTQDDNCSNISRHTKLPGVAPSDIGVNLKTKDKSSEMKESSTSKRKSKATGTIPKSNVIVSNKKEKEKDKGNVRAIDTEQRDIPSKKGVPSKNQSVSLSEVKKKKNDNVTNKGCINNGITDDGARISVGDGEKPPPLPPPNNKSLLATVNITVSGEMRLSIKSNGNEIPEDGKQVAAPDDGKVIMLKSSEKNIIKSEQKPTTSLTNVQGNEGELDQRAIQRLKFSDFDDDDDDDDVFVDDKIYEEPKINNRRRCIANVASPLTPASIATTAKTPTIEIEPIMPTSNISTVTTTTTAPSSASSALAAASPSPSLTASPSALAVITTTKSCTTKLVHTAPASTSLHSTGSSPVMGNEHMRTADPNARETLEHKHQQQQQQRQHKKHGMESKLKEEEQEPNMTMMTTTTTTMVTATTISTASAPLAPPPSETAIAIATTTTTTTAAVTATKENATKLQQQSNEISCDSDVAGETSNRDQTSQKSSKVEGEQQVLSSTTLTEVATTKTKISSDSLNVDKSDIIDFPLPEIPIKKSKLKREQQQQSEAIRQFPVAIKRSSRDRSLPRSFKHKSGNGFVKIKGGVNSVENLTLDTKQKQLTKEEQKMHYHNTHEKPTYLFGENSHSRNGNDGEIFLNKSGWVQVKHRDIDNGKNNRMPNYAKAVTGTLPVPSRVIKIDDIRNAHFNQLLQNADVNKKRSQGNGIQRSRLDNNSSKLEDLISRNEARKSITMQNFYQKGFLPVRSGFGGDDSPPPITPIISPPPAFQDSKSKQLSRFNSSQSFSNRTHLSVENDDQRNAKGMVFSRSFEYDTRKNNSEYAEVFSKSFDYDFNSQSQPQDTLRVQRERSSAFANLTGNSPNYLTRKESSFRQQPPTNRSLENSPLLHKAYSSDNTTKTKFSAKLQSYPRKVFPESQETALRPEKYKSFEEQPAIGRSRRAQFSRGHHESSNSSSSSLGFRSLDVMMSRRLNSCDSGARSDLSNDEEDEEEEQSSSLALSYNVPLPIPSVKKQRSLTPDKESLEIDSSRLNHNNLRKQRSLTPEKRSNTPEERRNSVKGKLSKQKGLKDHENSQSSLISKQSSSSRNSTLERQQKQASSRSSSSSSYSGDENIAHRRPQSRQPLRNNGDYRIRRSRSLQLSERSPNRLQSHKVIVRLGNTAKEQPVYAVPQPQTNEINRVNGRYRGVAVNEGFQNSRRTNYNSRVEAIIPPPIKGSEFDKSRSFDIESDHYNPNYDFDKSRSFDDEYTSKDYNGKQFKSEARSFSNDKVYAKPRQNLPALPLKQQNSQSYGSRLYEHDLLYDVSQSRNRSPIMDFRQETTTSIRSHERSPVKNGNEHYYRQLNRSFETPNYHNRDISPSDSYLVNSRSMNMGSSPGSDFDGNVPDFDVEYEIESDVMDDEMIKEAELVTEFLYGNKTKAEAVLNQRSRDVRKTLPPAGTPSSGSCTASSCDFWPHCGITNLNTKNSEFVQTIKCVGAGGSNSGVGGVGGGSSCGCSGNNGDGDGGGINEGEEEDDDDDDDDNCNVTNSNDFHIINNKSATCDSFAKINQQSDIIGTKDFNDTVILKLNVKKSKDLQNKSPFKRQISDSVIMRQGGATEIAKNQKSKVIKTKPPVNKSSSVLFLGEREMPITRERVSRSTSNILVSSSNGSGSGGGGGKMQQMEGTINSSSIAGGGGSGGSGGGGTNGRLQTKKTTTISLTSGDAKNSNSAIDHSKVRTTTKTRYKKILETKYKSRSLPNSLLSYSSTDDAKLASLFAPTSPLQMRAVSSPSLSENPIEPLKLNQSQQQQQQQQPQQQQQQPQLQKQRHYEPPTEIPVTATSENHQHVSGSVLQKFKKTLSHFKGNHKQTPPSHPTANNVEIIADSGKHRFGPLIWRSSKERRKTKHQRRDKCNSGDSGIQVELENDDITHDGGSDSMETSPSFDVRVRRANSAKAAVSSVKAKATTKKLEAMEKANNVPITGRSLSQPSGLDRLSRAQDESDTDSISSHHDTNEEPDPIYAEVIYPFTPGGSQELGLIKGSLVEVIKRDSGPWWWGRIIKHHDTVIHTTDDDNDQYEGWFPKDFVRVLPTFIKPKSSPKHLEHHHIIEAKNCDIRLGSQNGQNIVVGSGLNIVGSSSSTSSTSGGATIINLMPPTTLDYVVKTATGMGSGGGRAISPLLSSQQNSEIVRENVIKELLDTEINYVKLLSSLCLGYLKELRLHSDIFPTESVNLIFSNIEKIFRFQQTFLEALHIAVDNGRIAEIFLEFQSAFMVYSNYCNSYPRALVELELYATNKDALNILENCRISQNLPELPLTAHLLAPIQRICRYPLHLSELVKHTPTRQEILTKLECKENIKEDSIDCKEMFEMALTAMKRVTEMVNEGKRHSEYLSRIQARFDNFQGPPINVHSTRLFLQTDAIRMSPNLWNNTYTLFLFDRQLIYCKKDLLKRTHYIYKGRIFLDNCRILNLPDGKMFGVTLKNALRIYCDTRNKWYDFCFRSGSSKLRFLNTLSAERQFCGSSLFVSELAGLDDDNFSDREYNSDKADFNDCCNDYDESDNLNILLGNVGNNKIALNYGRDNSNSDISEKNDTKSRGNEESPVKLQKYSDTLPKKSRKISKDIAPMSTTSSNGGGGGGGGAASATNYDYQTASLGRRRIGNWFRKAKSTNSTPSQSPTHHPLSVTGIVLNSDSSSQSSPALGYSNRSANKTKIKDGITASS